MPVQSMGDMWRQQVRNQMGGQGAQNFASAAQAQALGSAMSIGAAQPGVAPAAAMRNAQQAAAGQAAAIQANAARMQLAEQQQGVQIARQQEAADKADIEKYVGMGLQAGGSAASMLLSDERAKVPTSGDGYGASSGMLLSDEEAKRALSGGQGAADQLIDGLEPESYRYRDEAPGEQRLGVMAQDVEAAGPMGREMVGDAGGGMRGLDKDRALSAALATIGRLGQRVEALERGGR